MSSCKRPLEDSDIGGDTISYESEPRLRYISHIKRRSDMTFVPVQFTEEEQKHIDYCISRMLAPEYVAIRNNGNAGMIF